jgi:hypothetical protein
MERFDGVEYAIGVYSDWTKLTRPGASGERFSGDNDKDNLKRSTEVWIDPVPLATYGGSFDQFVANYKGQNPTAISTPDLIDGQRGRAFVNGNPNSPLTHMTKNILVPLPEGTTALNITIINAQSERADAMIRTMRFRR